MNECRVCRSSDVRPFRVCGNGRYWRCHICQATLLDPRHFPDRDTEHSHYLKHDNRIDDPGYRAFLERLAGPLRQRLSAGSRGLDYGCGPGPTLAAMLRESGFVVDVFDPFFAPDASVLARTYNFITCTETAEHFHDPAGEFDKLMTMIEPGGWLAVMTCFQTEDSRFERWHYRLDPTHVVFYREATFRYLAARSGWRCEIPAKDIAFLYRPE